MRFRDQALERARGLFEALADHPFNRELAAGSLSLDRFRHYLLQDAHYLTAFGRALSLAAARADRVEDSLILADCARETGQEERALHALLQERFGLSRQEVSQSRPTPSCLGYCNFLLTTAYHESYRVLIGALLPCFWIYWEVGQAIARRSAPDNPYRAWIETYAGAEYASVVGRMLDLADRLADETGSVERERMIDCFCTATRLEWVFWDAAYRLERWPDE